MKGKEYIIYGKPSLFNRSFNIAHPEIEDPLRVQANGTMQKFTPQYTIPDVKNSKFTIWAGEIVREIWIIRFTMELYL